MKLLQILTMTIAVLLVLGALCSCELCPHENTEWRNITEPSCAAEGIRAAVCLDCGGILTPEAIPALEHTWGDLIAEVPETKNQIGVTAHYECSVCNSVSLDAEQACDIEDTYMSSEGLVYTIQPDGTYYVTGYIGSVKNVVIPKTYEGVAVTGIGNNAFEGNNKIKGVIIRKGITTIGDYAFRNCNSLTSVTIPDSVTELGTGAFDECNSLKEATIGASIEILKSETFKRCSSLRTLTLPASITTIEESVFNHCTSLKDVYFGGTKEQWEAITVASDNDPLANATIHYPGEKPEEQNGIVYELQADGSWWVIGYTGNYAIVIIPETYDSISVTGIDIRSIGDFTGFSGVVVPESVVSINFSGFEMYAELATIYYMGTEAQWADISISGGDLLNPENIYYYSEAEPTAEGNFWHYVGSTPTAWTEYNEPNEPVDPEYTGPLKFSLQSDGTYWVVGYTGVITDVIIPATYNGASVSGIGDQAFDSCTSLTSVVIPNSVIIIGSKAFYKCSSLTSIVIPDSVTSIGSHTFYSCSRLTSIFIPDSVTSIGYYAFRGCSSLTSVVIGDSVTSIGSSTFYNCSSLTGVVIPDSVTSIDYQAFYNCSSLTSVVIGDSVASIGDMAFGGCSSLDSVYITDIEAWCNISFSDYYSNPMYYGANLYLNGELVTDINIKDTVSSIKNYTFYGFKSLTSVTIPDSVTSIGDYAFKGCTSLTSVVIPDSVTSIGDYAFCSCRSLTRVEFAENSKLTSIGRNAFYNCTNLASVVIPDGVTSIDEWAFSDCSSLTSVVIGKSVTSIGELAFEYCYTLVEVINKSLLNITAGSYDCGWVAYYAKEVHSGDSKIVNKDNYLFYTYDGVNYLLGYVGDATELVLPASYNGENYEIYSNAFRSCDSLFSVIIPDSVTSIGEEAFLSCSNLTSVVIGKSVTSIGYQAFSFCHKLAEVVNRSSLDIIAGVAYYEYVALYAIEVHSGDSKIVNKDNYLFYTYNGVNYLIGYVGDDTELTLPASYKGESYEIYQYAFYDCRHITSVVIPDSVTNIGGEAFGDCMNLASVVIGDNVASIGNSAFTHCSITSIVIPDSVTSIGDHAFSGCSSLTSVVIPDSVTSIGAWAFSACFNLTNVIIGNGVTSIYSYAFYYCDNLQFNEYKNCKYLGSKDNPYYALIEVKTQDMSSYAIHENTKVIADYAFSSCSRLTSIVIPDSVTSIGYGAFYDCSSLTSIVIPDSVTSISEGALYGCSSLTSVVIPDSVTSIGYGAFSRCSSLTSVVIGNSVTSIDSHAFNGCSSLTSVVIPDSVTSIGSCAFSDCDSLESVVIGDSVTSIGYDVFYGCSSLTDIKYGGTEEQWNAISKGYNWNYNTGDYTMTYNYDGE